MVVYYSPMWPDAVDPLGEHFILTKEGKGAIAIFLLAATWWVFEVVPIGITSLTIGMLQALFFIRPAKIAFNDFMDPSVLFIFGSIVIGMVFTRFFKTSVQVAYLFCCNSNPYTYHGTYCCCSDYVPAFNGHSRTL